MSRAMHYKPHHYGVLGQYSSNACINRVRVMRFTHSNEARRFKSVRVGTGMVCLCAGPAAANRAETTWPV